MANNRAAPSAAASASAAWHQSMAASSHHQHQHQQHSISADKRISVNATRRIAAWRISSIENNMAIKHHHQQRQQHRSASASAISAKASAASISENISISSGMWQKRENEKHGISSAKSAKISAKHQHQLAASVIIISGKRRRNQHGAKARHESAAKAAKRAASAWRIRKYQRHRKARGEKRNMKISMAAKKSESMAKQISGEKRSSSIISISENQHGAPWRGITAAAKIAQSEKQQRWQRISAKSINSAAAAREEKRITA